MQGMFIFICLRSYVTKDGVRKTYVNLFDPDQNEVSNYAVNFSVPDFKFGDYVIAKMHIVRTNTSSFLVLDDLTVAREGVSK